MDSMDEKFFGDSNAGLSETVKTFDAFPKTRASYTTRSSRGGAMTILIAFACIWLSWVELGVYLDGIEEQHFTVEKDIGHALQVNIDITVNMACDAIHVNVQDAVGDRVLAGDILRKETRTFDFDGAQYHHYGEEDNFAHEDMWDVLSRKKGGGKKAVWGRTPKAGRGRLANACRVYGSLNVNKVQGDFHITAKGHGYWDAGQHIDHTSFNFSHAIDELSFGEYYPKLINPLDGVLSTTSENFFKYQYFLSVVPTFYHSTTTGKSLFTNQYSVTEHSREVNQMAVPGVFFKFDIEPISLAITDSRMPLLGFTVRLVNIIGGVLVSAGWIYHFFSYTSQFIMRKRGGGRGEGMLNGGRGGHYD